MLRWRLKQSIWNDQDYEYGLTSYFSICHWPDNEQDIFQNCMCWLGKCSFQTRFSQLFPIWKFVRDTIKIQKYLRIKPTAMDWNNPNRQMCQKPWILEPQNRRYNKHTSKRKRQKRQCTINLHSFYLQSNRYLPRHIR